MSNKGKYKTLSGVTPKTDNDVIIETWDIQERKLQTSHLGLPDFLNRHFTIKKVNGENTDNSGVNARRSNLCSTEQKLPDPLTNTSLDCF